MSWDGAQVKYADPQALRSGVRGAPPLAPSGSASVRSDSNDSILQRRSTMRDPGAGWLAALHVHDHISTEHGQYGECFPMSERCLKGAEMCKGLNMSRALSPA